MQQGTSDQGKVHIEIVEMAGHFLYLPFYYAMERDYFGYIDSRYDIHLRQPFQKTDAAAIEMLLSNADSEKHVAFAICDPTPILALSDTQKSSLCILASLVTNAAIWAVDKETDPVISLDGLKRFEKIIAFGQGTTTHSIARRIAGGRDEKIMAVEAGNELLTLTKHSNAVALSPDILETLSLGRSKHRLRIMLPLGTTSEYSNVMATALIGQKKLITEYPDLVLGLLRAIQRASVAVKCELPEVIEFARKRYNQNREIVSEAVTAANEGGVFPVNLIVQQAHWDNACRAYFASAEGRFLPAHKAIAKRLYTELIEPHRFLALRAIHAEFNAMYDQGKPSEIRYRIPMNITILSTVFFGAVGISTWLVDYVSKDAVLITAGLGFAVGLVLGETFGIQRKSWRRYVVYAMCLAIILTISHFLGGDKILPALIGGMVGVMVNLVTDELRRPEK